MKTRLVHRWMQQMLEAGFGLLFPDRCPGCGRVGTIWCQACDAGVLRIKLPVCRQCGEPIQSPGLCRRCARDPLPLQTRSYALYAGPLMKLILQIKYRNDTRLMDLLGGWLADLMESLEWAPEIITAVPLGHKREQTRGYNQAAMIAQALAAKLDVPYMAKVLIRTRETRSQVGLDAFEREANVRDAFQGNRQAGRGVSILVVDDLFTTGATLAACAKALYAAGAAEVRGVTIARAMGRDRIPETRKGVVHDR